MAITKKTPLELYAIYLAICILFSSCASSLKGGNTSSMVVEKSRLVQPEWVGQEPNQFKDRGNYLQYVVVKKGQANLTLGIRQGREFAVHAGEIALVTLIKDKLQRIPGVTKLLDHGFPMNRLEALILHELDQRKGTMLVVSDIYYEKWRSLEPSAQELGNAELFNVFVLVRADKGKIADFTGNLSDKLLLSKDPALEHLSKIIKNSGDFRLAH
jgi:hypothetical protein